MKRFNLKVLFIFLIFIELIITFQVKSNAINSKYSLGSNIVDDNYIMYTKELEKGSTILANSTTTTTSSTSRYFYNFIYYCCSCCYRISCNFHKSKRIRRK